MVYPPAMHIYMLAASSSSAYIPSRQSDHAGLLVNDLDATMKDLESRGVTFEEYDVPTAHTDHEVMTLQEGRGAFFKDSEGNILALNEVNPDMRSRIGI